MKVKLWRQSNIWRNECLCFERRFQTTNRAKPSTFTCDMTFCITYPTHAFKLAGYLSCQKHLYFLSASAAATHITHNATRLSTSVRDVGVICYRQLISPHAMFFFFFPSSIQTCSLQPQSTLTEVTLLWSSSSDFSQLSLEPLKALYSFSTSLQSSLLFQHFQVSSCRICQWRITFCHKCLSKMLK